jgi:hypothetical protein
MLEGKRDVSQICPNPQIKNPSHLTDSPEEKQKKKRIKWIEYKLENEKKKLKTTREKHQRKTSIFWLHAYMYRFREIKKIVIEIFHLTISICIIVRWHQKFSGKTIVYKSFKIFKIQFPT